MKIKKNRGFVAGRREVNGGPELNFSKPIASMDCVAVPAYIQRMESEQRFAEQHGPVKIYTPAEIAEFERKRGLR